jgi:hypothetical protein
VQNEPNFGAGGTPIADCGLEDAGRDGVRAKRSQFRDRIVRNEPNFARLGATFGG